MTTDRRNTRIDTETWSDELLFDWGQVVHATLIIHAITHVENFLATTSLLTTNIGKTLHLPLRRNFDTRNKVILFEAGSHCTHAIICHRNLCFWAVFFGFILGQCPSSIYKTGYG